MQLNLNPNMQVTETYIGKEKLPLLVIDNFVQDAEQMIEHASQLHFVANGSLYPGVRAPAGANFEHLLLNVLQQRKKHFFADEKLKLKLSLCQYSLVTTPPNQLTLLQRIPHFDTVEKNALAAVFYLFKGDLGGTSFYRHRKTGFEYIDETRKIPYYTSLEQENGGGRIPTPEDGYINGDSSLYTRIGEQKGVFNRLIVYHSNALHSGSIPTDFSFDPDPQNGRLTISSFIDCNY
ncbi:DUF6445 family protein [Alteromonadaceae bacterium BrNp21-10]|nr:DUF6445 family protein [Alteromonadaceae bacterium BrNp21-10]